MSSIKLESNASGTGIFTIASPNSNTNRTLTLPEATTTVVGTDATQTLTNKTIQGGTITSGTSVTASGTSVDFTGIPSWVKRITVMLAGVSTNGTSIPQIQLGYSGGVEITGYVSGAFTSNTNNSSSTTGFLLGGGSSATFVRSGNAQIFLIGSNLWSFSYSGGVTVSTSGDVSGGHKTTTGTLDRIRITTVNGTDTFDAGTINILYEG